MPSVRLGGLFLAVRIAPRAQGLAELAAYGLGYVPEHRMAVGLVVAHGHLHQVVGENFQGLLYIEYGFHVTAIIAGLVLAYGFLLLLRQQSQAKTTRVA